MSQYNLSKYSILLGLSLLTVLLLSGCGNRYETKLRESHSQIQGRIDFLKDQLDNRQLSNALLIEKYATLLIEQKPDFTDIASLLKQDATSKGKSFNTLSKRLTDVDLVPTGEEAAEFSFQELRLIGSAADVVEFNNSLADVVNTLASLSDGQLPVINVPSTERASAQQSNALVGNPSYGNWQQGNDGRSFWAWYGMYSMFGNVMGMGGGRHYYDSWSSRPHYSYYNNYGRNRWGSSRDVNRNYSLSKRHPNKYNRSSTPSKSRYGTSAKRASSYGGTPSKGSTNRSTSSRYSSYGSSSRSSSFSSSRSFRSGK
ncbi:MAG: hypothetical protein KAH20_07070 [Methylococcales bacterium]|nr:hypothetical protein [Methylococcales bacterium]